MKHRPATFSVFIVAVVILLGLLLFSLTPPGFKLWNGCSTRESHETWSPYGFVPSDRIVYQIQYESDSYLNFTGLFKGQRLSDQAVAGAPGLAQSMSTSLRGELISTVIKREKDTLWVVCHLDGHGVTVSVNGQKAAEQAEAIRNALYKEVWILLNSKGKIQSLRFSPDIVTQSKGYFQALLAMAQFVFAEKGSLDLKEWEVKEEDLNGNYIAHYQQDSLSERDQTSEKEPLRRKFRKTKIRYLTPVKKNRPGEVRPQKIIVPEGSLMAHFDFGAGHLLSLKGSELQTILFDKKRVGQAKTSLQVTFVSKESIGTKQLSLIRKVANEAERLTDAVSLSTNLSEKEAEVNLHRKQLGEASLESLLADLDAAEAARGKYPAQLFLRFKSLIYLHPKSCKAIGKILVTVGPKSLKMNVLGSALIVIGHKEAQAALVSAIKARKEEADALLVLMPALGGVLEPTVEAEEALREMASESKNPDIKATAELALGSIARSLTVTSPERAEKIIREFIGKVAPSSSETEIQRILHVLGNTGSTLALSTIAEYTINPTPHTRAAAMYALRWIESNEGDSLLAKGLSSDSETSVRLQAAHALGFRKMIPETYQAQKDAFIKDNAVEVRLAVLHNLSNAFEDYPETKKLIKEAAAKDSSKDVRKVANDILARYQKE